MISVLLGVRSSAARLHTPRGMDDVVLIRNPAAFAVIRPPATRAAMTANAFTGRPRGVGGLIPAQLFVRAERLCWMAGAGWLPAAKKPDR